MRVTSIYLGALLVASNVAIQAAGYRVEILEVPTGCDTYSLWHGLDETGVIGVLTCDDFATQEAVAWRKQSLSLVRLGTFGGPSSMAYGLNARGDVVGTAETPEWWDGACQRF